MNDMVFLRKVMEDFNMDSTQFAALIGVHPTTINRWLRGESMESKRKLIVAAAVAHYICRGDVVEGMELYRSEFGVPFADRDRQQERVAV